VVAKISGLGQERRLRRKQRLVEVRDRLHKAFDEKYLIDLALNPEDIRGC
jgi:hypothetical protein